LEESNLHRLMKKKNRRTTLGLNLHGVEELELAGEWYGEWLGWQEEEGGIRMPAISFGWCYETRLKGYPFSLGL
jgi:hypothetical protein